MILNYNLQPEITQVLLLLTNRCNLKCKHCYVSSSPIGDFGLSKTRVFEIIDEIHLKYGKILLNLSGGEPLSRKKECLEILEYASKKLIVKILTNGTLITPNIAEKLTELNVKIRISIDGGESKSHDFMRGFGSFEKTIEGVENLRLAGYPFKELQIYATISSEGIQEIPKIIQFADKFGIQTIKFETLAIDGRASQYFLADTEEKANESYKKYFKSEFNDHYAEKWSIEDMTVYDMSFSTLNVYYNGEVYAYTYTDDLDKEIGYLGNINYESLEKIVDSQRLSTAILKKFLLIAKGPARSLQAYWLVKK